MAIVNSVQEFSSVAPFAANYNWASFSALYYQPGMIRVTLFREVNNYIPWKEVSDLYFLPFIVSKDQPHRIRVHNTSSPSSKR